MSPNIVYFVLWFLPFAATIYLVIGLNAKHPDDLVGGFLRIGLWFAFNSATGYLVTEIVRGL